MDWAVYDMQRCDAFADTQMTAAGTMIRVDNGALKFGI